MKINNFMGNLGTCIDKSENKSSGISSKPASSPPCSF